MEITQIVLRQLKMKMLQPFKTSLGIQQEKDVMLVEVIDEEGNSGWGECVALPDPYYNEETVKTCAVIIEDFLIPLLFKSHFMHPQEVSRLFAPIRRNFMAKAALETAIWDLHAKKMGVSLANALGGTKTKVPIGVSLGIQDSLDILLEKINNYIQKGYKRIKIKIQPGYDIEAVRAARQAFPTIALMVDANSAYTLDDIDHLKQLDEFQLTMIEQPLAHHDIIEHAKLQSHLSTPLCLDESIHTLEDARHAIALGSCKVINIKIGRVGGITEAVRIHDYCNAHNIPVWCGGMFEAGIGRAHNIAISSLSNFSLPGDSAASAHYWEEDIITPFVEVENGYIQVPYDKIGIGYEPNLMKIEELTVTKKIFHKELFL